MNKNQLFYDIYLKIINEGKSPSTFTPEQLLDDVANKCFYSTGQYIFYDINQLKQFIDENPTKILFNQLVKNLKYKNDYAMLIVYFSSKEKLDEILNEYGYFNPHQNYKNFSMNKVWQQFKKFFENQQNSGANFNSIDVCPELGCVIGVNGKNLNSRLDFQEILDHQINHYFQEMNIHYKTETPVKNIQPNTKIINVLNQHYGFNIMINSNITNNIRHHLFNYKEFRSMCSDVFHKIIKYNQKHLNQLKQDEFVKDILQCNYKKYDGILKDYIIFCWVCKELSQNRWIIIRNGIKQAFKVKKNIFQKFYLNGIDVFRNFIVSLKNKIYFFIFYVIF